jgi:hypothetical protein
MTAGLTEPAVRTVARTGPFLVLGEVRRMIRR